MANINRTYAPATGDTILAAHLNTDLNTLYSEFNGNIDNSNIAAGAAIAISKTLLGVFTDWTSFTPTWTGSVSNPVIGNGTLVGKYMQLGKMVMANITASMGSTTTYGSGVWFFALPITIDTGTTKRIVGYALSDDATGILYTALCRVESTSDNKTYIFGGEAGGAVQSTIPFTWASGDRLDIFLIYQAA